VTAITETIVLDEIISRMSLTQQWLRDKAAAYSSADHVYSHTDAVLARFPALRPKLDVYSAHFSSLASHIAHAISSSI
jgi:hypothetical protein